ncbi:MAG: hypothetical protein M3Z85_11070, partial [Acidobacteriota bacterium]|nr:hypothetical protein [Acidobacteriota bacterium]
MSRSAYSRDLKIAAMRALDAGSATGEIARRYKLSPKLREWWRREWRARSGFTRVDQPQLRSPASERNGDNSLNSVSQ